MQLLYQDNWALILKIMKLYRIFFKKNS